MKGYYDKRLIDMIMNNGRQTNETKNRIKEDLNNKSSSYTKFQ